MTTLSCIPVNYKGHIPPKHNNHMLQGKVKFPVHIT